MQHQYVPSVPERIGDGSSPLLNVEHRATPFIYFAYLTTFSSMTPSCFLYLNNNNGYFKCYFSGELIALS